MPGDVVRFRVAGLTLALHAPRGATGASLPALLTPFAVHRGADIALELTEEPVPQPTGETLFDSGAVWRVHRHRGGLLYTFRTPVLRPPIYKAVAIDETLSRGRLFFPRPRQGRRPRHVLEFPLDELLFQHRLARAGSFEVHACGIVWKGGAVLFCGRSGAGKTTTARLWRRHLDAARILSDDRIVIARRGLGLRAFGTPWHGEGGFASPRAARLRAVFFLEHARRNRARALSPAEGAARLFARSFPPPWDATAVRRVLATCERVARAVPCHALGFRPDESAVDFVRDLLSPPGRPERGRRAFSTSPTR